MTLFDQWKKNDKILGFVWSLLRVSPRTHQKLLGNNLQRHTGSHTRVPTASRVFTYSHHSEESLSHSAHAIERSRPKQHKILSRTPNYVGLLLFISVYAYTDIFPELYFCRLYKILRTLFLFHLTIVVIKSYSYLHDDVLFFVWNMRKICHSFFRS